MNSILQQSPQRHFRILMVTCQYMPDVFGGAEKQCHRLSKELAKRGHSITILTSTQNAKVSNDPSDDSNIIVKRFYTGIPPDLLGRWFAFSVYWTAIVSVWAWRNRHNYDIVHCHQGKYGSYVGTIISKILSKPMLVKIGNSSPDMDLQCLARKWPAGTLMVRHIIKNRPTFVAISAVIADELAKFGCHDVVRIPNGIPVIDQNIVSNRKPGRSFFFHGRIEPIKRIEVLIEGFSIIAPENLDVSLHIVGDGSDLDRCKSIAKSYNCADRIHFYGESEDPLAHISNFDIFTNASRAEGFSNSLLEALALGKIMVSTPVSGAHEAICSGVNGYVAADFKPRSLADAMAVGLKLLEGSHFARAQSTSAKLVESRFSMPMVAQKYESLYQQLCLKS